ncbi:histidine phosphatase family protein [Streptosporangium sp. NPDC087985]|uniref:histidine phosphatase family protein n=1 Tax=Streptosporangium sp. NPDC087985 TaxID=3366196 RepID=UPI0038228902
MPSMITAVRHGQSESNAAFDRAEATGAAIVLPGSDRDVSLSPLGRKQATELGRRLATGETPEAVWCSPYRRAVQTWELVAAELDVVPEFRLEARLGDREMGALSGMNLAAIRERFPEQAEGLISRRYSHRAPEGESIPDVADRVREVLADLHAECADRRVLVIAHDAVVLMVKHVLEGIPLASLDAFIPVHNASISIWRGARPEVFNDAGHLGNVTF